MEDWRPKGRGRGVLDLQSWSPVRRPYTTSSPPTEVAAPADENVVEETRRMMAKYTFKANTDTPLGKELNLTPKEEVYYLRMHASEELWALVRNNNGEEGYVPFSYLFDLDTPVSSLPWLDQKKADQEAEIESIPNPAPTSYKPYVSAYNRAEAKSQEKERYYCDICNKEFNGPLPLQSHLTSKAHKEEVEALSA